MAVLKQKVVPQEKKRSNDNESTDKDVVDYIVGTIDVGDMPDERKRESLSSALANFVGSDKIPPNNVRWVISRLRELTTEKEVVTSLQSSIYRAYEGERRYENLLKEINNLYYIMNERDIPEGVGHRMEESELQRVLRGLYGESRRSREEFIGALRAAVRDVHEERQPVEEIARRDFDVSLEALEGLPDDVVAGLTEYFDECPPVMNDNYKNSRYRAALEKRARERGFHG